MTPEIQALGLSVILGLAQVLLAATLAIKARGLGWAFSPRDVPMEPLKGLAGRVDRAFYNFMETFPLFASVVLVAQFMGVHGPLTVWGAGLYLWARVIYVPIYMSGVHVLRTLTWFVSIAGIVLFLVALF
ncbi:MAG TPA: MAPEG family protein [Gammaproteobacteria bacterium]|nr:MAPEG family protein [Gammaproteobacteria bacterium]